MFNFSTFYEQQSNVKPNELKPGDRVVNVNPECDHYKSVGVVKSVKKIKQNKDKTAGNVINYKVKNDSDKISDKNGEFHPGEKLSKTEIQLKKIQEWVDHNDPEHVCINESLIMERAFDRSCGDTCRDFVKFCKDHLELDDRVKIQFLNEHDPHITTGCYIPATREIRVLVKDRGLVDVLRSIAHEMVHQKQHVRGDLTESSGDDGSDHENEAHAQAGLIMRLYQSKNQKEIY